MPKVGRRQRAGARGQHRPRAGRENSEQGGSSAVRFKETGGIFDPGPLTKLDEGVRSVHQAIENTAYCLNCTHQWPAMWNLARESTLVSPKCQWRLSVPEEFVSSGWWTTEDEELAAPII